jgi:hypothetical protein
MSDNEVAALAILLMFGAPMGLWFAIRTMQHRERMEMIKRGMPPAQGPAAQWYRSAAPPRQPAYVPVDLESPQRALRKGITVTAIGLALTIGLGSIGFLAYDDGQFHLGPWLLGGLIPLFIGIAQIVVAMISGATFTSPYARMGVHGEPPPGPASMPPPPPPFEGSYTYRPDGTTQELQRPVPPPERR